MPTLWPEELPKLMRSLAMSNLSVPTRCLIERQLLTLVRPSESSGARWAEIDLESKLWTILAERMKAKREHIFPSRKNPKQSKNSQTTNTALKRIGYGGTLVAHGLRSIASKAFNEFGFNSDLVETSIISYR